MATRPGSGQCLLDCPEDGEPLATRRESERRETEHTMDSLNLGERPQYSYAAVFTWKYTNTVCIQIGHTGKWKLVKAKKSFSFLGPKHVIEGKGNQKYNP